MGMSFIFATVEILLCSAVERRGAAGDVIPTVNVASVGLYFAAVQRKRL
jgi:hypothetical protein